MEKHTVQLTSSELHLIRGSLAENISEGKRRMEFLEKLLSETLKNSYEEKQVLDEMSDLQGELDDCEKLISKLTHKTTFAR